MDTRPAASGQAEVRLLFAGGSGNPYNFNGIGYDGVAAPASNAVDAYDPPATGTWTPLRALAEPRMDHRGWLPVEDGFVLVGGIRDPQRVVASAQHYRLPERQKTGSAAARRAPLGSSH